MRVSNSLSESDCCSILQSLSYPLYPKSKILVHEFLDLGETPDLTC